MYDYAYVSNIIMMMIIIFMKHLIRYMRIVNRTMSLFKYVHILSPRTCEYITFCDKKDIAGVIKIKNTELGRIGWIVHVDPT